ncbi:MAG: Heimdall-CTERM domain-containing surface protein [Candidatus Odinarchaeota archaeon]
MKRKSFYLSGTVFMVMLLLSLTSQAVTGQTTMENITGYTFGDEYFAIDVDFNSDPGDSSTFPSSAKLLADYVNPSNPKITTDPEGTDKDRQFFASYVNTSGVETGYMALEKIEQDVVIKHNILIPDGYTLPVHVNGTSPFQALMQHYESYEQDVFVTNFFNGFIAYLTTPADPWLDPSDTRYLGYTLAEENLYNLINTQLDAHSWDLIEPYGWGAEFNEPTTSGGITETSWSMEYSNLMVFWQDARATFPVPTSLLGAVIIGAEGLVTGGNLVAASLFDSVKFGYTMTENTTSETDTTGATWEVTRSTITADYNLGPVSLLITRDDSTTLDTIRGAFSEINDTNSFILPGGYMDIASVNIFGTDYVFRVMIPTLTFYRDVAARLRISAAAMQSYASGMGFSVVSSTNLVSVGETVSFPDAVTGQGVEYSIAVGDTDVFETSFVGKDEYDLDRSIDGGYVSTYPIRVDTGYMLGSALNIFTEYFDIEAEKMLDYLVFLARQVSPVIDSLDPDPADILMKIANAGYMTFVQMPEWSGYPVISDPTFSAVAAVKTSTGTESSSTATEETKPSSTTGGGIWGSVPGFELLAVVATLPVIAFIYRRRRY